MEFQNLINLLEINNGNIYDVLSFIFAILAIPFSIFAWLSSKEKDRKISIQQVKEANNRIFIELMKEYRREFRNISLHEQQNTQIFKKNISELKSLGTKSDEVVTSVYFIIDTLKNAYNLLKENDTNVEDSLWIEHFHYVFDPVRKPLFVSAFKKKAKEEFLYIENERMKQFVKFVEEIIEKKEKNALSNIVRYKKTNSFQKREND